VATSDRVLHWLESRKNLTGSALGVGGLTLTLTGLAGAYWPFVIGGLYAAGVLIAPPERPAVPDFPGPAGQLDALRGDLATLRRYLASVELPPAAAGPLAELTDLLGALLEPGGPAEAVAQDPEGMHVLARAIRQDVPESVDAYVRTRWWSRLAAGAQPPERHLERQLGVLHAEAVALAAALRETETRRQESHTRYLEERGGGPA
jgi:hypothetical protein